MTTPATPSALAAYRQPLEAWFAAGVAAVDPYQAVLKALRFDAGQLSLAYDDGDQRCWRSGQWTGLRLVAVGKAAPRMAAAALDCLPASCWLEAPLVITAYPPAVNDTRFNCIIAGHPLPDAVGLAAAQQVMRQAQAAQADELLLLLLSGGGSALLPAPVSGVSLSDKTAVTQLLLRSGATIQQLNGVRKHLSQLKGGWLTQHTAPADSHALILSDVIGDDLSAIASGPSVADNTTFADAVATLKQYTVWGQLPAAVSQYLQQGCDGLQPETPKPGAACFERSAVCLVGSNAISVDAVLAAVDARVVATVFSKALCGEARVAADRLCQQALATVAAGLRQPQLLVAGGETTVTVTGTGKGGRNQELALAFALAAEREGLDADWLLLSGGTDGCDGPTDAAGGVVDAHSLTRMRQAGFDPQALLDNNDAYTALHAAGDLLMTGATGTNVADLQLLLLLPHSY